MNAILYLHTDTSYEALENIQDLKITQTLNNHGYLQLTAIIQEAAHIKYATEVKAFETVEVVVGEVDNPTPIFKGLVKNVTIHHSKKKYYLDLQAVTGSYSSDIEIRSRSFQDKDMPYKTMLKQIMEEHNGGSLADYATNSALLGKFTMQFKETDFQFVRRMASRFHASIIPSLIHDSPKVIIGVPIGKHRGELEKYNFYVTKDLERYMISSKNENKGLTKLDTITFNIEIDENFEIGDTLTYYDKASDNTYVNLYIKSKEIEMVDGILRFRYGLCTKKGLSTDTLYNEKITGLSLKGVVLERLQDRVKVFLEIDDNPPEKAWEFQYSTPYTAEGSSGWYVMPEVNDTVLINFPNREEDFGLGVNSVRDKNTGTDKIGNPAIKYFRTPNGKEIKLAPNEITITCSNWTNKDTGEENIIYIQLEQNDGITIKSTKPININSDADINITADKNIALIAEDGIRLRCGPSLIQMDSAIEIVSSMVKVN